MLPSTPDRPERRQDVGVDLPGKDHLRHFERCIVGDATTFNDRLFNSELRREVAELFAAAVDNADADADLVQQSKFFGKRRQVLVIFRNLS